MPLPGPAPTSSLPGIKALATGRPVELPRAAVEALWKEADAGSEESKRSRSSHNSRARLEALEAARQKQHDLDMEALDVEEEELAFVIGDDDVYEEQEAMDVLAAWREKRDARRDQLRAPRKGFCPSPARSA